MFDMKNLRECAAEELTKITEKWSDAARAASAAGRRARGSGLKARKLAGRQSFEKSGHKTAKYPGHSVYAAQHDLKHFRSPGLTSTHFKDPAGALHVHDSKDNSWKLGKVRAKGYKLGSKVKQRARKAAKQDAWNARQD